MAPHPKETKEPSSPTLTGLATGLYFSDEDETEMEIGTLDEDERRRESHHRRPQQQQHRRNERAVGPYNTNGTNAVVVGNNNKNDDQKEALSQQRKEESGRSPSWCSCCHSRRLSALVLGLATLLAVLYAIVLFLNSRGIQMLSRNSSNRGDFTTLVSMSALSTHDTPEDDCWLAIAGHVYDLTDYAHPGGNAYIHDRCGRESTTAFDREHSRHYLPLIEAFARGKLQEEVESVAQDEQAGEIQEPTAPVIPAPVQGPVPVPFPVPFPVQLIAPQPAPVFQAPFPVPFPVQAIAQQPVPVAIPFVAPPVAAPVAPPVAAPVAPPVAAPAPFCIHPNEVLLHNSPNDCFYILYGDVFDFTFYVDEHPGGPEYIEDECGTDATAMYETAKKHDFSLLQRKGGYDYYLGPACAAV